MITPLFKATAIILAIAITLALVIITAPQPEPAVKVKLPVCHIDLDIYSAIGTKEVLIKCGNGDNYLITKVVPNKYEGTL